MVCPLVRTPPGTLLYSLPPFSVSTDYILLDIPIMASKIVSNSTSTSAALFLVLFVMHQRPSGAQKRGRRYRLCAVPAVSRKAARMVQGWRPVLPAIVLGQGVGRDRYECGLLEAAGVLVELRRRPQRPVKAKDSKDGLAGDKGRQQPSQRTVNIARVQVRRRGLVGCAS
jgi:hypothetical protein